MKTDIPHTERFRFVLTTFGSLGDLHPYLALGQGLQARGHSVLIATHKSHQSRVELAGIAFHEIGPDISDFGDEAELMARVMDPKIGPKVVMREIIMPHLKRGYEEISRAVVDADMLITHPLAFAAQLVAEKNADRLTWASVALAPASFLSAYDPPVLPIAWLTRFRPLGPRFFRPLFGVIKWGLQSWASPWHEFRKELGLPPTTNNPIFDGQFSPTLTLALFSPTLAAPQPDWPPNTQVTGFLFYDRADRGTGLAPELLEFLGQGDPPMVFTLGSSAVLHAGDFYVQSVDAAQRLGRRAVLLIGHDTRNRPSQPLPKEILACDYAPYSELLPRAAAVVHQGGIGTTAQALRAGVPMLVVPFAFDQPDNADRIERLGVGRVLPRKLYNAERAARELSILTSQKRYAARAKEVGRIVQAEDGIGQACQFIENCLRNSSQRNRTSTSAGS